MTQLIETATGMTTQKLDAVTQRNSAFESFQALLDAKGNYRPTILVDNEDRWVLAQAYDAAQAARGDSRRAFRGTVSKFVAPKCGTAYPHVGDHIAFWSNIRRSGVIEKIGPARVTTSFVTKYAAREAKRTGRPASRSTRTFRIDTLIVRPYGGWQA